MACTSGRDPYGSLDPDGAWDATDQRERLAAIARIRRDMADVTRALWDLELDDPGAGYSINRVCMWDDLSGIRTLDAMMGALRCGLNALAHLWGLGHS